MDTIKSSRKEESVLHSIFSNFSNFGFDKAKEQAEKEGKNSGTPIWTGFLNCLSQLSVAEKLNMNLVFLVQKSFLRKENSVRTTYEALLTDLADLEKKHTPIDMRYDSVFRASQSTVEGIPGASSPGTEGVLLHLCTHLILYIQARIQLIAFYEKLIMASSNNKWLDFEELYEHITEICNKNSNLFHHPVLIPLKTNFTYESDILTHLLGSLKDMQFWRFFSALIHLDGAHSKLNSWDVILHPKEAKKYSFMKSSPTHPLYQWLWQTKSSLVAKFSLFFYETLKSQSSTNEMKNWMSRQTCDHVAKIHAFQRKSDAVSVCLVFDTTNCSDFRGYGYHHPAEPFQTPIGAESYLPIFAYPSKPDEYWSTIVMRIPDCKNDTLTTDRVLYFYDQKTSATFFLCQADPRITIAASFNCHKSEKDNYIRDFVHDLAHQLRCIKLFANLKLK